MNREGFHPIKKKATKKALVVLSCWVRNGFKMKSYNLISP